MGNNEKWGSWDVFIEVRTVAKIIFFLCLNKESLARKLEFLNKGLTQVKQKYEELKSMCAAKDELITRLENEMRELSVFVEKTIKVF